MLASWLYFHFTSLIILFIIINVNVPHILAEHTCSDCPEWNLIGWGGCTNALIRS